MIHDLRKIIMATNLPIKDIAKGAGVTQEMLLDIVQYEKYRPPLADRERIERFLLPKGLRSTEVRMVEVEKEKADVLPEPPKPLSTKEMLLKVFEKHSMSEIAAATGLNLPMLSDVKNHDRKIREHSAAKIRACYAEYLATGKLPAAEAPKIKIRRARPPGSLGKKRQPQLQLATSDGEIPTPSPLQDGKNTGGYWYGVKTDPKPIVNEGSSRVSIAKSIVTQIGGVLSMAQNFGLSVSNDSIRRIQDAAYYELTRNPLA